GKEIYRLWDERNVVAQAAHGSSEIVGAIGVVADVAEKLVAQLIAGGDQHVVRAVGGIERELQHRPPVSGQKHLPLRRYDRKCADPGVRTGQKLQNVV